jgi:hypothetical protein
MKRKREAGGVRKKIGGLVEGAGGEGEEDGDE